MAKKNAQAMAAAKKAAGVKATDAVDAVNAVAAKTPAAKKVRTGVRIRLTNGEGRTLILAKRVNPRNGAIRVIATISVKGAKPQQVGRETLTSHDEANSALDRLKAEAAGRGWTERARTASGAVVKEDKKIVIPEAAIVADMTATAEAAGVTH